MTPRPGGRLLAAAVLLVVATGCSGPAYLWRIEGSRGPTYLLGTYHRGVALEDLPGDVLDALDESRILYIETDIEAVGPDAYLLPPGESMADLLGPLDWAALQDLLGPDRDPDLDRLRPWVVEKYVFRRLVGDARLEPDLLAAARQRGLAIGHLEDWREQVEFLNAIPHERSLLPIREALRQPEAYVASQRRFTSAYVEGSVDRLFGPAILERMEVDYRIRSRNRSWIPTLEAEIAEGGAFVAVGLAHLLGDESVLTLLEERGHRVTRLAGP